MKGTALGVLVTEMRAGRARWVGGASCILAVTLGLTLDTSTFLPGLADPLNLSLTALAYGAPLAAGGSAMATSAVSSSGLLVLAASTSRGSVGGLTLAYAASLVWHIAAYLLLVAGILIRSDLSGASTMTMLLLPVTAVVMIAVSAAVGALAGLWLPTVLAAPLSAVAVSAWIFVGSYLSSPARFVSPIFPEVYYQVFLQPNGALLTALSAAGVSACLGALAVVYDGRRVMTAVAAIAVAGVAVTVFPRGDSSAVELRAAPARPRCLSTATTTLCGWPESASRLPGAVEALARVRAAVAPVLRTPDDYREPGLPTRLGTPYQIPLVAGDDPTLLAALAVTPGNGCRPIDSPAAVAAGELNAWIQARVDANAVSDPQVNAVVDPPTAAQRAWVATRVRASQDCK